MKNRVGNFLNWFLKYYHKPTRCLVSGSVFLLNLPKPCWISKVLIKNLKLSPCSIQFKLSNFHLTITKPFFKFKIVKLTMTKFPGYANTYKTGL